MIYCVEDDRSIRELIIYALKSNGYEAIGFSEGRPFFKALESGLPVLILLDIMLPGEDGIEILKKLKASSKTQHIPVIMLTAKSAEYDKVLGLDSGQMIISPSLLELWNYCPVSELFLEGRAMYAIHPNYPLVG